MGFVTGSRSSKKYLDNFSTVSQLFPISQKLRSWLCNAVVMTQEYVAMTLLKRLPGGSCIAINFINFKYLNTWQKTFEKWKIFERSNHAWDTCIEVYQHVFLIQLRLKGLRDHYGAVDKSLSNIKTTGLCFRWQSPSLCKKLDP